MTTAKRIYEGDLVQVTNLSQDKLHFTVQVGIVHERDGSHFFIYPINIVNGDIVRNLRGSRGWYTAKEVTVLVPRYWQVKKSTFKDVPDIENILRKAWGEAKLYAEECYKANKQQLQAFYNNINHYL